MSRPGEHPLAPGATPWNDDHHPTAFQQAVVDAVRGLQWGELTTFSDVADEIGHPGSAQAVANTLRAAIDIPWWRVVPADGRLYRSHVSVQGPLLEAEGHRVDARRRVHQGPPPTARSIKTYNST
ncbi:MAG: methylated-DNA-protein-cysteine methyltransferase related protein [Acidimicrobiaceae bacterium]